MTRTTKQATSVLSYVKLLLQVSIVVVMLSSCASQPRRVSPSSPFPFAIGYSHGPLVAELVFHSDGYVAYWHGGPIGRPTRLSNKQFYDISAFLLSPEFEESLDWLRKVGYEPGCCDQKEVALVYQGESLGYPVCGKDPLPSSVERFIALINKVATRHFGRRFVKLPTLTCNWR